MMDNNILMSIEDLRLYFRTDSGIVQAVDKVSFTLGRGPSMVVVGESGCGKSTLARTILGLALPK